MFVAGILSVGCLRPGFKKTFMLSMLFMLSIKRLFTLADPKLVLMQLNSL